jgi:nitric oxide reductase activation protein
MIGYLKGRLKGSVSGWEKSHFGGFYRMIQDYPYIKLDYSVRIEATPELSKDLGWYTSEKLIKLFLIKLQSFDGLFTLTSEIVEKKNFVGLVTKKYEVTTITEHSLIYLLDRIQDSEYQPLFAHYFKSIIGSTLEKELPEDKEDNEGEGGPEDEEDESEDRDDSGEGKSSAKSEPKPTTKEQPSKVIEAIKKMVEFKPSNGFNSLSDFSAAPVFKTIDVSYLSEYRFGTQEIKDAENLLKLLDISYDPKSDVVKSLRAGKLDVQKIAEVPAGSTSIYKQTVEDVDTKPFGVCILADLSGSMGHGSRLQTQKRVLNTLYLAMSQIVPSDKLWIYGHTGDDEPEIYTFCSPYDTNYAQNIRAYDEINICQNYDGPVIEAIHKKVREVTDDRIIFISLSDGQPAGNGYGHESDIIDMKKIVERARRDEFVTVGIGIQYMSTPGLYQYAITVDDLSQLVKDASKLINKVVLTEFK